MKTQEFEAKVLAITEKERTANNEDFKKFKADLSGWLVKKFIELLSIGFIEHEDQSFYELQPIFVGTEVYYISFKKGNVYYHKFNHIKKEYDEVSFIEGEKALLQNPESLYITIRRDFDEKFYNEREYIKDLSKLRQ